MSDTTLAFELHVQSKRYEFITAQRYLFTKYA